MLLPALLLVAVYQYGPMLGIVMAFQDFSPVLGFAGSPFVGFANFRRIFELPDTIRVIRNTLFISALKVTSGLIVPIGVSLLLNEVRAATFKRSVQTIVYLPHFLSWVILGGITIDILSPSTGIVNALLGSVGVRPVFFLGEPRWFPFVLVVTNVWKEFGFATIVYLAALTSVDPSLYEAARIDGANRLRQTWHVTLPGISPIIVLMVTLSLGSILNAGFDQVFNLYNPQVYATGDIIDTFVYRLGLVDNRYAPAAAVGLFKSFVSLVLVSTAYYAAFRLVDYRIF
jgi:putative aldouronate transport system permease protein